MNRSTLVMRSTALAALVLGAFTAAHREPSDLSGAERAVQGTPAARNSHALSIAPGRTVLLFGGAASAAPRLTDTSWLWTASGWAAATDAGPHARNLPAMAFDSRRNVTVLYGGAGLGSGTRYGDTWEWNGRVWEERVVRTPGARDHHAMAFDEARGKMVVYGGLVGTSLVGGTWTFDGTAWMMADSSSGPGPVGHHAMAYDSRRQRVVMYGGAPASGPRLSDTWEWDGQRWERIATPVSPGPRSHHRMAYDVARRVIVLFGGGDTTATDTWSYDGQTWERHQVPGPAARWSAAMAYDAARERIVLYGGNRNARPFGALDDTWLWDGKAWTESRP